MVAIFFASVRPPHLDMSGCITSTCVSLIRRAKASLPLSSSPVAIRMVVDSASLRYPIYIQLFQGLCNVESFFKPVTLTDINHDFYMIARSLPCGFYQFYIKVHI